MRVKLVGVGMMGKNCLTFFGFEKRFVEAVSDVVDVTEEPNRIAFRNREPKPEKIG
jgi:hypothetical protein